MNTSATKGDWGDLQSMMRNLTLSMVLTLSKPIDPECFSFFGVTCNVSNFDVKEFNVNHKFLRKLSPNVS